MKESGSGAATVEDVDVELSPQAQQATMVQRGEQRGADVDIEGADVLVAGGRGLGKAEGFELVEALAKAFGGNSAVAATRAVVDAGWYPYAAQIGQTGKTVAPKLYLAAGISGAIQHKVGMRSRRTSWRSTRTRTRRSSSSPTSGSSATSTRSSPS